MRILLSAYACEPGRGSEPGVGWNWACEIARRGHDVYILTRENNRIEIEHARSAECALSERIHPIYFDLPKPVRQLKRATKMVLPYYFLWQLAAYRRSVAISQSVKFDLVHHITFGSVRHFSFLGNLKVPFILGPLGGGETSPFWLRWHTGLRGGLIDTLRDMMNLLARIDPIHRLACRSAKRILVKTPASARLIPKGQRYKVQSLIEIGIKAHPDRVADVLPGQPRRNKRVIYVGRLVYWKGMAIGIKAFAQACKNDPGLTLTIVGDGPERKRLVRLSKKLNIHQRIEWCGWLPQERLSDIYRAHGIALFPSLHDSSGNVILEALYFGLPVVCLDLGGPAVLVPSECGRVIDVSHGRFPQLLTEISDSITRFSADNLTWLEASTRAQRFARSMTWASRVEEVGFY